MIWQAPESFPRLREQQAHLWRADLDALPPETFQSLLTPDERARAARFHFEHDRARFIVARGVLRTLLARYAKCAPQEIAFEYSKNGKPEISSPTTAQSLRFNLSHSHSVVVLAFAWHINIGVDIEWIRDDWSDEYLRKLAARFFHPRECGVLHLLHGAELRLTFFQFWTRKEALVKARGDGLWRGLDFDVTGVLDGWTQLDFEWENFAGALAVEAREAQVEFWESEVQY